MPQAALPPRQEEKADREGGTPAEGRRDGARATDEAAQPVAGSGQDEAPSSLLQRFGSRNHPKTLERKARMQKARAGMQVTPEMLANYTAVRAFLYGEWFGALLCCASVALVYMFASPRAHAPPPWDLAVPLLMFAVGAYVYWRNRTYYARLGFPWASRWHNAALIVAGSGATFWLLFGGLYALWKAGVTVMPFK